METRPVALVLFYAVVLVAGVGCGDDGVGDPVKEHSAYALESTFDVQGDFGDSGLGTVLDLLRDMSDDEDDPGLFVVEQLVDKLPAPLSWAASPLESTLGREANTLIYSAVPTVADELKGLSEGLTQAARRFKLESDLEVGIDAKGRLTGKHELQRILLAYRDQELEVPASELGDKVAPAVRIPVHLEAEVLQLEGHKLRFPTGTLLTRALDRVVIPAVLKEYLALAEVFARWFACAVVAVEVAKRLDGALAVVMTACVGASEQVADALLDHLLAVDKHGQLRLAGQAARAADGRYRDGEWAGSYRVGKDTKAKLDRKRCGFGGETVSQ